jgi:hypothetical protein
VRKWKVLQSKIRNHYRSQGAWRYFGIEFPMRGQ